MHLSTYEYLQPTPEQIDTMKTVRDAAAKFSAVLDMHLPDGPDKTHTIRTLRQAAMWANIAITRNPDGSPRA